MMSTLSRIVPDDPEALETWIKKQEAQAGKIKPGAEARILWANEQKKRKTDHSLVYLHGLKASHGEGFPVHQAIAEEFGCNLYLSRLYGHGLQTGQPLKDLTAGSLIESALHAFTVGKSIGKKVIIMGTSTGASLGLYLASQSELRSNIAGLVLYSPLIKFYGIRQWLLCHKAGRIMLNIVPGKNYTLKSESQSKGEGLIWYNSYMLQGALALGAFIEKKMNSPTFSRVYCPVFAGYYYKNKRERDQVVSVPAIQEMVKKLATPDSQKMLVNFPEAGTHVISSGLFSQSIPDIKTKTAEFLRNNAGLKPSEGT